MYSKVWIAIGQKPEAKWVQSSFQALAAGPRYDRYTESEINKPVVRSSLSEHRSPGGNCTPKNYFEIV
jgi:hypothetical protein